MTEINEQYAELLNSSVYRTLSVGDTPADFADRLEPLRLDNQQRLKRLFGICGRLVFAEQIHNTPISVTTTTRERIRFLYQIDRLATYLTTTCIDIATGERFQHYHEWLKEAYESNLLSDSWDKAVGELGEARSASEIEKLFVKWTFDIYKVDYQSKMSIRQAFKEFVWDTPPWFKEWLFKEYIVEYLDFSLKPSEPRWTALADKDKCRRLAFYLYEVRNLYTHTVIPYQPMDFIQRSFPQSGVGGYVATIFPPSSKDEKFRSVALPAGVKESDVIRLLVIIWLRKHWLKFEDRESLLERYWANRK